MTHSEKAAQLTHEQIVALLTAQEVLLASQEQLQRAFAELKVDYDNLKRQLDWFKKQLFGQKSERRPIEPAPNQLSLGEVFAIPADAPARQDQPVAAHVRKKNLKNPMADAVAQAGLRFGPDVPVQEIRLTPSEIADRDAGEYEIIDEKITYRLAQQPGSYVVLKYIRPVVKLKEANNVACHPAPAGVLEKSYADVSFLAGMLVDKFVYHQPLYRQHQKLTANHIELSRITLTNQTHGAIELLLPIADALLDSVRASAILVMDETPIKAGHKEKRKLGKGYFWPLYGDKDEVVFRYAPSRGHEVVREVLGKRFKGILLTDGYSAYERYIEHTTGITHARCWSHARRGFIKAENAEPQRAAKALDFIRQLYAVEQLAKEHKFGAEGLLALRQERSRPIVDAFFHWLREEQQDIGLLPKNPFTFALCYALQREQGLRVFLGDPNLSPDTNHLERALRVIPMGRKNWLFCWTEIGATHVAAIQSLLVTCKLHGVDPYDYLVDVLQRVAIHPAKDIELLTPRHWKQHFAAHPLRSDLFACRNNVGK